MDQRSRLATHPESSLKQHCNECRGPGCSRPLQHLVISRQLIGDRTGWAPAKEQRPIIAGQCKLAQLALVKAAGVHTATSLTARGRSWHYSRKSAMPSVDPWRQGWGANYSLIDLNMGPVGGPGCSGGEERYLDWDISSVPVHQLHHPVVPARAACRQQGGQAHVWCPPRRPRLRAVCCKTCAQT